MEIVDINGKKRNALSAKKVVYQIPDAVNGGIAVTKLYVEVIIVGQTGRTWKEWYDLQVFKEYNPKVNIDAL